MKATLLYLLLALALASCGTKPVAVATPIAPTVAVPVPTAPVDLKPVTVDLKPVIDSNRQMAAEIERGKQSIFELNRELASVDSSRMATLANWQHLTTLGKATAAALDESEKARSQQQAFITTLETTVAAKTAEVVAAEQEKINLRVLLVEANSRITKLTSENQALQGQWLTVRSDLDAAKAATKAEVRWKWRFFIWGTVMTLATAFLVASKLRLI